MLNGKIKIRVSLVGGMVLLCVLVWLAVNRGERADYEVVDLPVDEKLNISLSGLSENFTCVINNNGQVAGNVRRADQKNCAYLWDGQNGLVELPEQEGKYCFVEDINNRGQIVGYLSDIDYHGRQGECRAFFIDTDRTITLLPIDEDARAYACGINDKGEVVGLIYFAPFDKPESEMNKRIFVWDKVGGMRIVDEIGDNVVLVCGINEAGQIAGLVGTPEGNKTFFWSESRGVVQQDDYVSLICDINDNGSVLGVSYSEEELFIWNEGEEIEMFDINGEWIDECGMNDAEHIVGNVFTEEFKLLDRFVLRRGSCKSFLKYKDGKTVFFDHLFDDGEQFNPVDINNDGWVVGYVIDWVNKRRQVVVLKPE